jgi:nucleotide-binding universal stress UspA family protein
MYRLILVPLDGSALAEQALTVAATLAEQIRATLQLVHVHAPPVVDEFAQYGVGGPAARETAEHYMLQTADRVRAAYGGTVSATMLDGRAAASIATHAAAAGADLIVMSSHGRTGASRFWFGSVADALIRSSTIPVLVVRGRGDATATATATREDSRFSRVLVPLDGSSAAEQAIPHAIALGSLGQAHVHLLRVEEVAEDLRTSVWVLAQHEPDDLAERLRRADHYLKTVSARLGLQWGQMTHSAEARAGHRVGETIAAVATERDVDLIAMTTHGRGASRLVVGSVADKVIRGTTCSLLLTRAR